MKMQNHKRLEAFKILREMTLNKNLNETVKRAVRSRLEAILEAEQKKYDHWKEHVAHRLNKTRQKQIRQAFEKKIKAYNIVIYDLTHTYERGIEPTF